MTGTIIEGGFPQNPEFEKEIKAVRRLITDDSPFVILYLAEKGGVTLTSEMTTANLAQFSMMLQAEALADYMATFDIDE